MTQILKKICDHPLLLTKRAAEDVLEEMDPMLKAEDVTVAEKLAMFIADADRENFEENHVNISCKISFILSLLVMIKPIDWCVLLLNPSFNFNAYSVILFDLYSYTGELNSKGAQRFDLFPNSQDA